MMLGCNTTKFPQRLEGIIYHSGRAGGTTGPKVKLGAYDEVD